MLKSVENRAIMRNNNQSLDVPFTKAESETEEATMAYSYNRLLKLMIDKKINKTTLRREAGITSNAMAKMGKDEPVAEDPNIIYDPVCVCSKTLFRCKKCSMPATWHSKGVRRQQE